MLTLLLLSDVNGSPIAKLDLPEVLRVGDPVAVRFRLNRTNGGRSETLEVDHLVRVMSVKYDATRQQVQRTLTVETAQGRVPTWRSVKRSADPSRRLGPARHPRTPV